MVILASELGNNEEGIIKNIMLDEKKQAKLSHLGLVKGVKIQKVFKSIFGDPIAFKIYGTLFALRKEDASRIEVYYED